MNKGRPAAPFYGKEGVDLVETYYIAHRDELLAFVNRRLGGVIDEAEDIVQDVFLRLLLSDRLITEVTLPSLVYTVARHLVTDYYRRRTTHEEYEHVIRGWSGRDSGGMGTGLSDPESIVSVRELTEMMERGVARIPENCREIYRMHVYGGMKVSEISAELGEGYKSVEYRLGTARKSVRRYLQRMAI